MTKAELGNLTWLADITREQLRDAIPDAMLARGHAYADEGRVIQLRSSRSGDEALAVVSGSRGSRYRTVVSRPDGGRSMGLGSCSCPVGWDCKHVAAVVLMAQALTAQGLAENGAPRESGPPGWRQLAEAVAPSGTSGEDPDAAGLAVFVSVSREHDVRLRLMREGKQKPWVQDNLRWAQLDRHRGSRPVREDQRRALAEVYATTTVPAPLSGAYYRGSVEPAVLSLDGLGAGVWAALRRARRAGVQVLPEAGVRAVSLHAETLELAVDVTTAEDGQVALRALALPAGRESAIELGGEDEVWTVGSPAHGLARLTGDGDLDLWPLREAPPGVFTRFLGQGAMPVPSADLDDLRFSFLPAMSERVRLISSDGSVDVSPPVPPTALLHVEHAPGPTVRYAFHLVYRRGDDEVRVPAGQPGQDAGRDARRGPAGTAEPNAGTAVEPVRRDGAAEADALRGARTVMHGAPLAATLRGMDAMRFATRTLPVLRTVPDLTVEEEGTPADFREVDQPEVHIGLTPATVTDWFDLNVIVVLGGHEIPFPALFAALARDEEFFILDSGEYFRIDLERFGALRDLIEEARALSDDPGGPLRVSRYQAGLVDDLQDLSDLSASDAVSEQWRENVASLRDVASDDSEDGGTAILEAPPAGLRADLRIYQHTGYDWLARRWDAGLGAILADDMGLGKTVQTLALLLRAKERHRSSPVPMVDTDAVPAESAVPGTAGPGHPALVVAPTSVLNAWREQAEQFAPDLKVVTIEATAARRGGSIAAIAADADVVLTTYTLVRLEAEQYRELAPSALVLDEAQAVKNPASRTYRAVHAIPRDVTLVITGTPLENSLLDLWALLSLAAPGLFPSAALFTERYRRPIELEGSGAALDRLRRRIRPFLLRRTKQEVARDLPTKTESHVMVQLDRAHSRRYEQQLQRERGKLLGLIEDMDHNRVQILSGLTRLRQLALDPALVDPGWEARTPPAKVRGLVAQIEELAAEGHRALVFSSFTGFLATVREQLDAAGIDHEYLDGRTRNRRARIESFRSGTAPAFLISLKAGGIGLTLTEADYVFVLDPWWNPAAEEQAVDRTHRIGQERPVVVYRLVSAGTIEEKVVELQRRKRELFGSVIDGGDYGAGAVTADDIRDLLAE